MRAALCGRREVLEYSLRWQNLRDVGSCVGGFLPITSKLEETRTMPRPRAKHDGDRKECVVGIRHEHILREQEPTIGSIESCNVMYAARREQHFARVVLAEDSPCDVNQSLRLVPGIIVVVTGDGSVFLQGTYILLCRHRGRLSSCHSLSSRRGTKFCDSYNLGRGPRAPHPRLCNAEHRGPSP